MDKERTIKLTLQKAQELYKTAEASLKALLEANFTKAELSTNIIDRIESWNDVLEYFSSEKIILPYTEPTTKQQKSTNAFVKLQYIIKALNEGWIPDFTNSGQYKYYPWFERKSGGWAFDHSFYDCCYSFIGFGFHLKSRELSDYIGKQFIDVYKEYLPE